MDAQSQGTSTEAAALTAIVEAVAHAGPVEAGIPFAKPKLKRARIKPAGAPVSSPDPIIDTNAAAEAGPITPSDELEDEIMENTAFNAAETTAEQIQDKTEAVLGGMNDRAKGAMERGAKMLEEMNAFGKGNVKALVESSKIAARGFEMLGQDAAEYGRRSFETASANARTLAGVKSPTEFLKLQGDFMRQAFDSMVAETSKTTETMLKLAGDVAQPLSNRVALAADKMKVAA